MTPTPCPNCGSLEDDSTVEGGSKPDLGLLTLVFGGMILSFIGFFLVCWDSVRSVFDDGPDVYNHAPLVFGIVSVVAGAVCFCLALWVYRAKRMGTTAHPEAEYRCSVCGHERAEF